MDKSYWLLATLITVHVFLCMPSFGSTASTARDLGLTCRIPSGCSCPGETVTCKCIAAAGTRFIEWTGSIFEIGDGSCTGVVVHNDNIPGECKEMVASGYSALDSHFVSVLNFTINLQYNGKTVQCLTDHGPGRSQALLGNVTIDTTPGPIQALQDVRLLNATKDYLTFNWTRASSNCTSLWYTINATKDCGVCPNRTNSTQVLCSLLEVPTNQEKICKFTVNIAVCGDLQIWKSESNTVTVELKLPDPPFIECKAIFESGLLLSLTVNVTSEMGAFTVSGDGTGSALSYNISYSDITSGSMFLCDSVMIMVSSCENRVCSHLFRVATSSTPFCKHSTHVLVAVFAANIFGNGSKSIRYLSESPQTNHDSISSNVNIKYQLPTLVLVVIVTVAVVLCILKLKECCNSQRAKSAFCRDYKDIEAEEEVDLSTTHVVCLEVKQRDITTFRTQSTVPMAQFAERYLPGYRSEWQCGYYELMPKKPESFTPDQRVLLMTVHKSFPESKEIVKLVETTIGNVIDDSVDFMNVQLSQVKKPHDYVFIKSRNDDYELKVGQKFLYCARFTEVNGHVEECDKEDSEKSVHKFAIDNFKLYREGCAYREVCTKDDMPMDKLSNKSVLLSKKSATPGMRLPGRTEVYHSTNLNAHLLLLHKFNKLPMQDDSILCSCTKPFDDFALFIHTSGHKPIANIQRRRILFCIQMSRIDKCSYCKVEPVPMDFKTSSTHLQDRDKDQQEISMADFGQSIVGSQYDQQLGYGYHELKQGSTVRLKQFKKIVLMDKNKHLFTGDGAQQLIGLREEVQEFEVADLNGTHWTHVFVESRGKNRKLIPGSSFLFYVPLKKLEAYYEVYKIKIECDMSEFAKSKIPGFNPTRGYGYCEIRSPTDVRPKSTIILMNKSKELFSGPGAHYYVKDKERFKEWEHAFVRSLDTKLAPGTRFLYCEYSQV